MGGIRLVFISLFLIIVSVVDLAPAAESPSLATGTRRNYDLSIEWKVTQDNERLAVTGSLKNVWVYRLRDIELRALLKGGAGTEIGRATFMFLPLLVPPGTTLPFGLAIPVSAGQKPTQLELLYMYRIAEDDEGDIPQFQSITVDLDRQKE